MWGGDEADHEPENATMHAAATITAAEYHAARKMICENMSLAIKSGTGAVVDVTDRAAGRWTISGNPADVEAAAPVLRLAGLRLTESVHDDELGETFAYWEK